ncbi:MAG: 3,4-dihydroxy-2-butanone-4-phosphate synthase [Saprospiraceae bacterium]|nr:3,4-dihydroxy-2-butanone-4-phosphate synthase [Saprospiraceae bacterium]MBK7812384.1 3,4-dihydroxy-2-butanone-4-phosphate synthase [Saprospiraceae bacterium]MBK9632392.1 3,4-dihydroxy-2-butanone-4-phosphate synthase [Saprospiraceae bacterium]
MIKFHSIEDAISDFRNGKLLIVVDDEDRENEGDFICAAETITPELVNFMAKVGRGLICAPMAEEKAEQLQLPLMVRSNTSLHETAFTISVDLTGNGCTTGISAHDRAQTLKALADDKFVAADFARPGHIFPLRAKSGGVLQRTGHTEAAVDLAKLAGMNPVAVLVEILNEDGSMARLPQLLEKSKELNLKIISISDLIEYRLRSERLIQMEGRSSMTINHHKFEIYQYKQINSSDKHIALVKGEIHPDKLIPIRAQYCEGFAEIIDLMIYQENAQLSKVLQYIQNQDCGIILLLSNEGKEKIPLHRIIPEIQKPNAHPEQDQREIGIGSQILKDLGVKKMQILTNNPRKNIAVEGYGLEVVEYVRYS